MFALSHRFVFRRRDVPQASRDLRFFLTGSWLDGALIVWPMREVRHSPAGEEAAHVYGLDGPVEGVHGLRGGVEALRLAGAASR